MKFSPQQNAIFDFVKTTKKSAFVEAVAGAGKTTTLVEVCRYLKNETVAFLAFNKKIAVEIESKLIKAGLNNVRSGTFHSFGLRAWGKVARAKVDGNKIAGRLKLMIELEPHYQAYKTFAPNLVSLAKQRGLGLFGDIKNTTEWFAIVDHFDLSSDLETKEGKLPSNVSVGEGIEVAQKLLAWSIESAYTVIDFDDMIYMPLLKGVKFDKFDTVLVDEAQDTNPVRRAMVKALLKN